VRKDTKQRPDETKQGRNKERKKWKGGKLKMRRGGAGIKWDLMPPAP